MLCLTPFAIRDKTGNSISVPCGRCAACYSRRRQEWKTRITVEEKAAKSSAFITLTYNDENIRIEKSIPVLHKHDVQKFLKRLRKRFDNDFGISLRYYICGEYGTRTYRPHYHLLLFLPIYMESDTILSYVDKSWQLGNIHLGKAEEAAISYSLKYMMKQIVFNKFKFYKDLNLQLPFSLMSKGIGKAYIDKMIAYHLKDIDRNYITSENGVKTRLPRYYRDRIYDKNQRQIQNIRKQIEVDKIDSKKTNIQLWIEAKNNVERALTESERITKRSTNNSKI